MTCWRNDAVAMTATGHQSMGSRKVPCVIEMPPVPSLPTRLPPNVPTTMPPSSGRMYRISTVKFAPGKEEVN